MTEYISFIIKTERVTLEQIESDLKKLGEDVSLNYKDWDPEGRIEGLSSPKTYEKIFDAKLDYKIEEIIPPIKIPQKRKIWYEVQKAEVPEHLKGKIKSVEFGINRNLITE